MQPIADKLQYVVTGDRLAVELGQRRRWFDQELLAVQTMAGLGGELTEGFDALLYDLARRR